jgi:hypothetical protein
MLNEAPNFNTSMAWSAPQLSQKFYKQSHSSWIMRFKNAAQRKAVMAKLKGRRPKKIYTKVKFNNFRPTLIVKPSRNSKTSFEGSIGILGADGRIKRKITKNSYVILGSDTKGVVYAGVQRKRREIQYIPRAKRVIIT